MGPGGPIAPGSPVGPIPAALITILPIFTEEPHPCVAAAGMRTLVVGLFRPQL
jgi:hypothetical protein